MKAFRIGAGAGYSGDRIEPAVALAERGAPDALELRAELIGVDAIHGPAPFLAPTARPTACGCAWHCAA